MIKKFDGFFIHSNFIKKFDEEMVALSSAPYNGGLFRAKGFFFMHVDKNYSGDYVADCREFERKNKLNRHVGFMTAATIPEVMSYSKRDFVEAYVTAGITNPGIAGEESDVAEHSPGTINIALIIKNGLTLNGMVNVLMTATEAKTRVMMEKYRATGTTSDGIGVFCYEGDINWAGTATEIGQKTGVAVERALRESILKWEKIKC
jgi:adenosylcobinamide hydrolase